MTNPTLRCICCDKKLAPIHDDEPCYQPSGGVMCTSTGNYGSTAFDSIHGEEELLFFVCDECLMSKKESIYLINTKSDEPIPAGNRIG